jgi:hypothetical protein
LKPNPPRVNEENDYVAADDILVSKETSLMDQSTVELIRLAQERELSKITNVPQFSKMAPRSQLP